jgi:ABC-type Fe3+/spermidine/putrescine transport system ATPase subunit
MIAGFEHPTSGQISIGDRDVTALPPYQRDTGMVFQQFALFPHMTVGKNVAYGLRARGGYADSEIRERVHEMLELVELPDIEDRKPEQLSGGQQQRVALARALAPEPAVLLLDEPLASLDKKLRETMQKELREIQEKVNITTIFVTHNQTEAMTMSDRLVVMNDGQFEQVGEPSAVYDLPANRFVADFLGTSNLFQGRLSHRDGATFVDSDVGPLEVGQSPNNSADTVTVVVRPENVDIADKSTGGKNGVNVLPGTVEFKRNLGSVVHYHVSTTEGPEVITITQRTSSSYDLGTEVNLLIRPTDCLVLPE